MNPLYNNSSSLWENQHGGYSCTVKVGHLNHFSLNSNISFINSVCLVLKQNLISIYVKRALNKSVQKIVSLVKYFDCLEHKCAKYILLTYETRVQLSINNVSYALLSLAGNMHLASLCPKQLNCVSLV